MIHHFFSVYDSKAEAYLPSTQLPNKGMFLRALENCLKDTSHPFSSNPHDYTVYEIAIFDDNNGKFSVPDAPILLCKMIDLIPKSE